MKVSPFAVVAAAAFVFAHALACDAQARGPGRVTEFAIAYPEKADAAAHANPTLHGTASAHAGSTHEITFDERRGGDLWITGQNYDALVRVTADGRMSFRRMPDGSGPHGIEFDADGLLWVTLEFHGRVVAFDRDGNLWVQQYVDHNNPVPAGRDHIVRVDKAILTAEPSGLARRHFTFYPVPTRDTVMHRIIRGPDGRLWFTEMHADKVGRLDAVRARP